jgi:hypothetical protein
MTIQICIEAEMNDTPSVMAGGLGMLCGVIHGYLGETRVVRPIENIRTSTKRVLSVVMVLTAIYWIAAGAIVAAGPLLADHDRQIALYIAGAIYGTAAIANFWANRGRHFGWILLSLAAALDFYAT